MPQVGIFSFMSNHVTVPDQPTYTEFVVTVSQSDFQIPWTCFSKADINVLVDGVALTQSQFTFIGNSGTEGGYEGGVVTLNTAVSNKSVLIYRSIVVERTDDFGAGPVTSRDRNTAIDRIIAMMQDRKFDQEHTIKFPAGDMGYDLPDKETRANKVLAFDADGEATLGNLGDYATNTALTSEASTRGTADTSLTTAISTQASTRASADTSLATSISTEASTRIIADSELATSVSTETSSRISGDGSLTSAVSTANSTRASADASLTTAVSSDASTRVSQIASLATAVNAGGSSYNDTSITTAVSTANSTRASADTSLTSAVSTEASTRASVDTSLNTAVSTETSTRVSADSSLTTAVSTEISTRGSQATSLATNVTSLTTSVSSETSTRTSVDSSITTAFQSADTSLATAISNAVVSGGGYDDSSLTTAVSTADSTRASADTSLSTAVSSEISRATSAETSLAALGGGGSVPSWHGNLIATLGNGDPNMGFQVAKSTISPSSITTSVARAILFRPECDINVNSIHAISGSAGITDTYKMALYRVSDGVRLTSEISFDTGTGTLVTIATGLNLDLVAGELYVAALAVSSAASALAGIVGANLVTNAPATAPLSYPDSMDLDAYDYFSMGYGKFTISGGTLPSTLPTIDAIGSGTVYSPIFFLDHQ